MEKTKPSMEEAERFLLCVDDARFELTQAFLNFAVGNTLESRSQLTKTGDWIIQAHKLLDNLIACELKESPVPPAKTIVKTVDREDISEQVQRVSIKQQVLDLIERKIGVLDKKEIESELPHIRDGSIRMALHELHKSGQIDRVGCGLYTRIIKLSSKEDN